MSYEPKRNMSSPWGAIQHVETIAAGIWRVCTAGHGGVKLDRARNAKVPEYMRRDGGWYEEDCDWCIPAVVLSVMDQAAADHTFINWHPDEYAKWHLVPIESLAGRSRCYDERVFNEKHADDLIVVCASGSWHERCPNGWVLVDAKVGGHRGNTPETEWREFLVPDAEYAARGPFGFVVDPERHTEVTECLV